MGLEFYTSMAKGLKLKVRKFFGLIPMFLEVTGEKLFGMGVGVGRGWSTPPSITTHFLIFRKQQVILNGQVSPWVFIKAMCVPELHTCTTILLIYINDLSSDLSRTGKLFADDTSLFFMV